MFWQPSTSGPWASWVGNETLRPWRNDKFPDLCGLLYVVALDQYISKSGITWAGPGQIGLPFLAEGIS